VEVEGVAQLKMAQTVATEAQAVARTVWMDRTALGAPVVMAVLVLPVVQVGATERMAVNTQVVQAVIPLAGVLVAVAEVQVFMEEEEAAAAMTLEVAAAVQVRVPR
jgi:hypothetical protein